MIIKQFELYNRWGNVVWSTRDKNGTWNGKIESVEAEAGTYFYVLRYKCESDQKDYLKKGDLILIR
jgi:gliding motility-associated-like protein